ncbi:MAG: hypothetical protein HWN65_09200 [Candidatus Helarchaeota archaeon]|nr:hypothetical protein [Candidatus Helarchaeota archaeon]
MINIDIIGDFRGAPDEIMDNKNLELFLIDKITKAEDFQEVLIVFPPVKKKVRWKAYSPDEAEVLYDYVEKGGILILIPPFNPLYLEKLSEIYEKFQVSPVFQQENLLAHVNAHMINFGKESKLPIKKYIHFLVQEKESAEVVIEGNYRPIFAFQFVGEGVVILYGLGSKKFWEEDLTLIFKYLKEDYASFWEKSKLSEKELENIVNCSRKENHKKIQDEFINIFIKTKRFNEFLEIKDPDLKETLLQKIQSSTIEDEFKNLSGKFIAKKYRELHRLLNKEYPDLIKNLQKFVYKKVIDMTINEKTFNTLYESDFLPPEAAYLLVFYLDPEDPENYKKFKENLTKLIQWNKTEKIFEEEFLKELAWDHL